MKDQEQVVQEVRRRLAGSWHVDVDTEQSTYVNRLEAVRARPSWPHSFPLGPPTKAALEAAFHQYQREALAWRDWSSTNELVLIDAPRIVHGTRQRIPTHVTVPSLDHAARLCGPDWIARIDRARKRNAQLRNEFPNATDLAATIRDIDRYSEVDFHLLRATAHWFTRNSAAGLTPRQVPIPGLHAKWLNTRHRTIAVLAGVPDLQLLPPHPQRLHFTYLDPDHRRNGGRWHDSATVGDTMRPAYTPAVIVISENKDTALHFPELARAISVVGVGRGGATAAAFDWLRTCPNLIYWGDMDAAGFEILDGFRNECLPVSSILMDIPTYEAYEQFGTNLDVRGNPIPAGKRRPLPRLTDAERALYECLTDPDWKRHRRVEQERIPLATAAEAVSGDRAGTTSSEPWSSVN